MSDLDRLARALFLAHNNLTELELAEGGDPIAKMINTTYRGDLPRLRKEVVAVLHEARTAYAEKPPSTGECFTAMIDQILSEAA